MTTAQRSDGAAVWRSSESHEIDRGRPLSVSPNSFVVGQESLDLGDHRQYSGYSQDNYRSPMTSPAHSTRDDNCRYYTQPPSPKPTTCTRSQPYNGFQNTLSNSSQAAQMEFNHAQQPAGESCGKWADRVLTLACSAFLNLSRKEFNKQVVYRFCHGSFDREAGLYALNSRPKDLKDAINLVGFYQHKHRTSFRHFPECVKQPSCSKDVSPLKTSAGKVGTTQSTQQSLSVHVSGLEGKVSCLGDRVSCVEEKVDSILSHHVSIQTSLDSMQSQVQAIQSTVKGLASLTRPAKPSDTQALLERSRSNSNVENNNVDNSNVEINIVESNNVEKPVSSTNTVEGN